MDTDNNIELFQELVRCGTEMFTWCYDADGRLLSSNCPKEAVFSTAFSVLGCKDKMLAHARQSASPILLGTALGVVWGAAFEQKEGKLYRVYVLGPTFFQDG